MSVWLSETEFRQSDARASGITINIAFLREIKDEHVSVPRQTETITEKLNRGASPHEALDLLSDYRDVLQTYFTLEQNYGYFQNAATTHPAISRRVAELQKEHEPLIRDLLEIIELTQQIVYHESGPELTLGEIASLFECFARRFEIHEQQEMDLMLRLCNEEIGVGD